MYYYQNIMPDAIIAYKKAISINSSIAVYWSNLSLAYTKVPNYAEAEKAMNEAIHLNDTEEYRQRLNDIKELVVQHELKVAKP